MGWRRRRRWGGRPLPSRTRTAATGFGPSRLRHGSPDRIVARAPPAAAGRWSRAPGATRASAAMPAERRRCRRGRVCRGLFRYCMSGLARITTWTGLRAGLRVCGLGLADVRLCRQSGGPTAVGDQRTGQIRSRQARAGARRSRHRVGSERRGRGRGRRPESGESRSFGSRVPVTLVCAIRPSQYLQPVTGGVAGVMPDGN